MARFDEWNQFNHPKGTIKRSMGSSWIIHWTLEHDYGVAVFWSEVDNYMACFSLVWPHTGWQEYADEGIVNEHCPWGPPDDDWIFIGIL